LEKRAEQVLPVNDRGMGEREGEGGRNDPNNVSTCE
jgi:hypothetical protein